MYDHVIHPFQHVLESHDLFGDLYKVDMTHQKATNLQPLSDCSPLDLSGNGHPAGESRFFGPEVAHESQQAPSCV